jgi:hypothetical protein
MLASSYLIGLDYRMAFLLNTFMSDKQAKKFSRS